MSCKPFFVLQDEWKEFQEINPLANHRDKSRDSSSILSIHRHSTRSSSISVRTSFAPKSLSDVHVPRGLSDVHVPFPPTVHLPPTIAERSASPRPGSVHLSGAIHRFIPDVLEYDFFDYIAVYFARERSRFFHHASAEELGSFSARIPLHSLQYVDRSRVQDVLEIERWVLAILGYYKDDVSETGPTSYGHLTKSDVVRLQSILYKLCSMREVIDEVVCYVMKESVDCSDALCELKAYEVLAAIVGCIHPTDHLFNYLVSYLYRKIYDKDEVSAEATRHG